MGFYDLPKDQRLQLMQEIQLAIHNELKAGKYHHTLVYFNEEDTYIRKAAYLAVGRIYIAHKNLHARVVEVLWNLMEATPYHIRQTAVNAAGEIGINSFPVVERFFDKGLFDEHHTVRNAVIGSVKKMGEKNPEPVLAWAKKYLHHTDMEVRREICHGIELRGRTHPQDILPLLKELQFDKTARVRNTLVHVLGQIAYKKGCLPKVIADLQTWENIELVQDALKEIIDVHHRYRNFAALTQQQARDYIRDNF